MFRICVSSKGRYKIQQKVLFFWIDAGKVEGNGLTSYSPTYESELEARASLRALERYYTKKTGIETWKPLEDFIKPKEFEA